MPIFQATANQQGVLMDGMLVPNDPSNRHWRRFLQFTSSGGSLLPAPELALEEQATLSKAKVAAEAAALVAARLPAQSDAYVFQLEEEEAAAALASADPLVEADYPLLAALVDDLGADLDEVALAVSERQASTVARVAAVHAARTTALKAIDVATSAAAVLAIVDSIQWPAEAGAPSSI
jgi:UTP-glucose-1-phosphate uridylyltransferase